MMILESSTGNYTALPPPIVAAACEAIKILPWEPKRRALLFRNALRIREGIIQLGYSTTDSRTPIIPILFNIQNDAARLSDFLKSHYIIAPFVSYPVKTARFIVRITVSAAHTDQQVDELLTVLELWKKCMPGRLQ
jgi:7-keto-8-aminopelargonate synthetase-like enzyme